MLETKTLLVTKCVDILTTDQSSIKISMYCTNYSSRDPEISAFSRGGGFGIQLLIHKSRNLGIQYRYVIVLCSDNYFVLLTINNCQLQYCKYFVNRPKKVGGSPSCGIIGRFFAFSTLLTI